MYRPGPKWHIKIGDFGISKIVESNDTALRTGDYSIGYGAPEILDIYSNRETSDYTNAVDIWCVGVTVFRLLTTKLPFPDNKSVVEYSNGRLPFPTEALAARRCSDAAKIFVQRLMTDIPATRPSAEKALGLAWLQEQDSLASTTGKWLLEQPTSTQSILARDREVPLRPPASGLQQDVQIPDDDDRTIISASSRTTNNRSRDPSLELLARRMDSTSISTDGPSSSLCQSRFITSLSHATEQPLGRHSLVFNDQDLWLSYPRLARGLDSRPRSLEGLAFDNEDRKPLLWWATALGDQTIAAEILNIHGIDVNAREETRGWTSLAKAIIDGNVEMCQLMLQHRSININQTDNDLGLSPLMIAAADGHVSIVVLLLRHRLIDVDLRDKYWGRTALSWAAGHGRLEVVRILLETAQADIKARDFEGKSPLSWAVAAGNLPLIEFLHSCQLEDGMAGDFNGRTPLWEAANRGHAVVTRFLLTIARGQPVETDHRGRTPLIIAATHGHLDTVSELLSPDLNSNVLRSNTRWRDRNGQNALICAAKSGNQATVQRILMYTSSRERRILVDEEDNDNRSALSWAAAGGYISVVIALFNAGSRTTELPDSEGQLPLHKAIRYGHEDLAIILLRKDHLTADVKDNAGRTPLSWAVQNGMLKLSRILLASGVDVNSYDDEGWSVAHWAAMFGRKECLEELFSHESYEPYDLEGHTLLTRIIATSSSEKANRITEWDFLKLPDRIVDFPDGRGRTPLSWAAEKGDEQYVRFLLRREVVNPSAPDKRGWTPMSFAIFGGHELIAMWLDGCQSENSIDRQQFWCWKPKWAVKDAVISRLIPCMALSNKQYLWLDPRRSLIRQARPSGDQDEAFSDMTEQDQIRAQRLFSKMVPIVKPQASKANTIGGRQNLDRDTRHYGERDFTLEKTQRRVRSLVDRYFKSKRPPPLDAMSVHGPEVYERMYNAGYNVHLAKHSQDLSATRTRFIYEKTPVALNISASSASSG